MGILFLYRFKEISLSQRHVVFLYSTARHIYQMKVASFLRFLNLVVHVEFNVEVDFGVFSHLNVNVSVTLYSGPTVIESRSFADRYRSMRMFAFDSLKWFQIGLVFYVSVLQMLIQKLSVASNYQSENFQWFCLVLHYSISQYL